MSYQSAALLMITITFTPAIVLGVVGVIAQVRMEKNRARRWYRSNRRAF